MVNEQPSHLRSLYFALVATVKELQPHVKPDWQIAPDANGIQEVFVNYVEGYEYAAARAMTAAVLARGWNRFHDYGDPISKSGAAHVIVRDGNSLCLRGVDQYDVRLNRNVLTIYMMGRRE